MSQKLRAIVPAAGKGTRLQMADSSMPKAMVPLAGRPMLEIVLENLEFIDPKDITIVVGYAKERIIERFGDSYRYAEQTQQLGTGHAVMMCADEFRGYDGDVLITFGDMPLFRRGGKWRKCAAATTLRARRAR